MTIPTLIADYQEKVTVSRLTEAYSIISNAYRLIKVNEGPIMSWYGSSAIQGDFETDDDGNQTFDENFVKNADAFWDMFEPYLKVAERCKASDQTCKKYDNIYELGGTDSKQDYAHTATLTLTNGMTLLGGYVKFGCPGYCADFGVDINGIGTKPNTLGKDIFYFYIPTDAMGILPSGNKNDSTRPFGQYCNPSNSSAYIGYGCTAWVIYNKNMDYLKCFDKLGWDSAHSCKD